MERGLYHRRTTELHGFRESDVLKMHFIRSAGPALRIDSMNFKDRTLVGY
ncbi:MAG: hypothetical protein OJF52_000662 [Nitrospira sp.]|nr:MAG: hypothetical protein OJF52_000662 [Nitrospira sp.]